MGKAQRGEEGKMDSGGGAGEGDRGEVVQKERGEGLRMEIQG